jgi:hypothetical protein
VIVNEKQNIVPVDLYKEVFHVGISVSNLLVSSNSSPLKTFKAVKGLLEHNSVDLSLIHRIRLLFPE